VFNNIDVPLTAVNGAVGTVNVVNDGLYTAVPLTNLTLER
jgi:hypothetical protein